MSTLDTLIEEYKSILIAEKHNQFISEELNKLHSKLAALSAVVNAISTDLEKPETFTIKSLFSKALVNESAQHEIKRQEYLLAALEYNQCKQSIGLLEFEKKIIEEKLLNKAQVESELNRALDAEKISISDNLPEIQKKLFELHEALRDLVNYKRELQEALEIALKTQNSLKNMSRELINAQQYDNWGTFYREIQMGKKYKKAYMDRAVEESHKTGQLIKILDKELYDLADFQPMTKMSVFDELLHFQKGFYDSLITDWVIENDVIVTQKRVENSIAYLTRIMSSINSYLEKTEEKKVLLQNEKEEIIAMN